MSLILARGERVYECDVCNRAIRMPENPTGLEVMGRCIITNGCLGTLHKVLSPSKIASTPSLTPAVEGVDDWFQRRALYNHEQKVPTTKWIIPHGMGIIPLIQGFIHVEDEVTHKLSLVETNKFSVVSDAYKSVLTFDVPHSGTAQCISTSSTSVAKPVDLPVSFRDITHLGELTIATLNSDPSINITVRYSNTNTGEFTDVVYKSVDSVPSVLSPWAGSSNILLGGKKYYVRSFNIVTSPGGDAFFRLGSTTASGSSVSFPQIGTTYSSNIILLSTYPHSVADRVTTEYIDIASTNTSNVSLALSNGELKADSAIIRSTFPPIITV